ncbi:MAG: tyrosine-protein phosphatase [Clostridia bacterium]|nr:tyrosine-protein phosphatase [Clostridia bacterium]
MILLKTPQENETICLQTAIQKRFDEEREKRAAEDGSKPFRFDDLERVGNDLTQPLPISFSWEQLGDDSAPDAYYYLLVAENKAMDTPWVYITKDRRQEVYNLKIGTRYFWCVQKNGQRSEIFSFTTACTLPRCIKIDHVFNVRDMGGYPVTGGRIRQGLVYRGGECEAHMHLTPEGADELKRLGIRTDLDMRGEIIGQVEYTTMEALGMTRVHVPCLPYKEVLEESHNSATAKFFRTFTDEKNYPIYFHCWGGADRTGTFAFILGAFLGMSLDDLVYEFEFTSLTIWGVRSRNMELFTDFMTPFMALEGETLQEKAATYLKTFAGLTDEQLNTIYTLMVEHTEG